MGGRMEPSQQAGHEPMGWLVPGTEVCGIVLVLAGLETEAEHIIFATRIPYDEPVAVVKIYGFHARDAVCLQNKAGVGIVLLLNNRLRFAAHAVIGLLFLIEPK